MGEFGDLAPFGLITFGDAPTDAETIYDSLQAGSRKAYDVSVGTHIEASNFARALAYAGARETMQQGARQRIPQRATSALADLEKRFGVIPTPGASDQERRDAVDVKRAISRGSRGESLITALTALLGTDFWKVRRVAPGEIATSGTPGAKGAWNDPARPHFFWKLVRSIIVTGSPYAVGITPISTDVAELPKVGDVLCVQPENLGLAEQITVAAVDSGASTITATFLNAHDEGAAVLTHAPVYASNQRSLMIAVKPAAATDLTTLGKIRDLAFRICRGVTRVYIVASSDGITAGPFTADSSHADITPVGTVTL